MFLVGFTEEYTSEKHLFDLQNAARPSANVKRDGYPMDCIRGCDLVPVRYGPGALPPSQPSRLTPPTQGDIIAFKEGDLIPGDVRIISESNLWIDQYTLTGQVDAVKKR
jgi:magnesium-transporting ATPase (P-type)